MGGKIIESYEGVIHQADFKISPFRKVLEKLFALKQKHTNEKKKIFCKGYLN